MQRDTSRWSSRLPGGSPARSTADGVLRQLRALGNPLALAGMSRYGINPGQAYGVKIPDLRRLAMYLGRNHRLALRLWQSGIHEARILAGMIADPELLSDSRADQWVKDFDSWDVCDQVCLNLFAYSRFAFRKCVEWSAREEEFVKRAAFALMACLAVKDKEVPDRSFLPLLRLIERESVDGRNHVKKAVNWALRQIGKRSLSLNEKALQCARRIQKIQAPSSRWIGTDALRELRGSVVQKRLRRM